MTFLVTLRGRLRLNPVEECPHQFAHGDHPALPRQFLSRLSLPDTSITDFDFNHEPELTAEGMEDNV